jgi:hypothetical protein
MQNATFNMHNANKMRNAQFDDIKPSSLAERLVRLLPCVSCIYI